MTTLVSLASRFIVSSGQDVDVWDAPIDTLSIINNAYIEMRFSAGHKEATAERRALLAELRLLFIDMKESVLDYIYDDDTVINETTTTSICQDFQAFGDIIDDLHVTEYGSNNDGIDARQTLMHLRDAFVAIRKNNFFRTVKHSGFITWSSISAEIIDRLHALAYGYFD